MRQPSLARLLLPLLATGWSCVFLLQALDRWRFERICAMSCGPYWPADLALQFEVAEDWHKHKPLALAALPLALWGAGKVARAFVRHARTRAA